MNLPMHSIPPQPLLPPPTPPLVLPAVPPPRHKKILKIKSTMGRTQPTPNPPSEGGSSMISLRFGLTIFSMLQRRPHGVFSEA